MHVQSCIVYKWMAVLILVIKDIKVEQLNVFTSYLLFEEFLSVEHCNEFSFSFKKKKNLHICITRTQVSKKPKYFHKMPKYEFIHKTRENILLLLRKRILLEINQSNKATHETGNCKN